MEVVKPKKEDSNGHSKKKKGSWEKKSDLASHKETTEGKRQNPPIICIKILLDKQLLKKIENDVVKVQETWQVSATIIWK